MPFNPDTNIEDCVALVIDKSNPRYGQIAKLTAHDWKEYGQYFVVFTDGKEEQFPDGLCKGDTASPIRVFYRRENSRSIYFDNNNAGPRSFIDKYLSLGGNLESLANQYKSLFGTSM